uniref:Immunity-related GTPase family, e4 n=1 Tax=Salmo trutta TaxID=8032 RepID=A0A674D805_SALTR
IPVERFRHLVKSMPRRIESVLKNAAKAKKDLDLLENVTLNIAVTGESGSGKSTFVNALLGLRDGDKGAPETGEMETTMKAIRYSHPTMPNMIIWDLPGISTPYIKAKKYLKEVKFETYDFFIIIGTVRFKEIDIMLATEIQKMKKMFYFVRSKIDNDIRAEAWKKNYREEDLLSKIRQNCEENLKTVGSPNNDIPFYLRYFVLYLHVQDGVAVRRLLSSSCCVPCIYIHIYIYIFLYIFFFAYLFIYFSKTQLQSTLLQPASPSVVQIVFFRKYYSPRIRNPPTEASQLTSY